MVFKVMGVSVLRMVLVNHAICDSEVVNEGLGMPMVQAFMSTGVVPKASSSLAADLGHAVTPTGKQVPGAYMSAALDGPSYLGESVMKTTFNPEEQIQLRHQHLHVKTETLQKLPKVDAKDSQNNKSFGGLAAPIASVGLVAALALLAVMKYIRHGRPVSEPLLRPQISFDPHRTGAVMALAPRVPKFQAGKRILVTGGNTGIGFALCRQLAVDHGCQVYLGSRDVKKGEAAVKSILESAPGAKCELIQVDTSSDESVAAAAQTLKSALGDDTLYALVNNAGQGLNTCVDVDLMISTNLFGPKRMCEAIIPLLDPTEGRIVNLGSGSGPMYVGAIRDKALKRQLCQEDQTWEMIESHLQSIEPRRRSYGLSKALLVNYTSYLASQNPILKINACSPGFIDTNMTSGYGASKTPEEGTVALKYMLFGELEGNGWYYGSDGYRSPLHFMRNPGEPEYDGAVPF